MIELTREKRYQDIVKYLEDVQTKCQLNGKNQYILNIAKDIVETQRTGLPSKKVPCQNKGLFANIKTKNYDIALNYLNQKGIALEKNDIIYILLTDMNHIIKEIDKKTRVQQKGVEVNQRAKKESNNIPTIINIYGYLMNQEFYYEFRSIKEYLEGKGKSEYQFLIEDLAKISLVNEDNNFIEPITNLMYIGLDKFRLNPLKYVESFYESFERDRFQEASIYLDIVAKSKNLEQDVILPPNINLLLDNISGMLDSKKMEVTNSKSELTEQYLQELDKEDVLPQKIICKE